VMHIMKLARITPLYTTKESLQPKLWLKKGAEVHVLGDLHFLGIKIFASTPGGFVLISEHVKIPSWATEREKRTAERPNGVVKTNEEQLVPQKSLIPTTATRKKLRNVRIYKVVANDDSMFDYVQNCSKRDTLDGDGSNQRPDWRALYTQFLRDHVLGTIPYRWNRFEHATLLEVTFKELDIVVLDGSIFFDGKISGDDKARVVKEVMNLAFDSPLMENLGNRGMCALVRENEDEWELIIPHNLFAKLDFTEKVIMKFRKHEQYPLTESWKLLNGEWRCFETDFDKMVLPDLPHDFL